MLSREHCMGLCHSPMNLQYTFQHISLFGTTECFCNSGFKAECFGSVAFTIRVALSKAPWENCGATRSNSQWGRFGKNNHSFWFDQRCALWASLRLNSWHFKVDLIWIHSFIDQPTEIVQSHVSHEIQLSLRSLYDTSSPMSSVWIRNLPINPFVSANPTNGAVSLEKKTFVAEAMFVAFGELTSSLVVGYSWQQSVPILGFTRVFLGLLQEDRLWPKHRTIRFIRICHTIQKIQKFSV